MEDPEEYDHIMAALEDLQDLVDALATLQEPGSISLDDYLADRDCPQLDADESRKGGQA